MARDRTDKRHALQQDGTLRPARTRVRAGLFWQHPTFFDPRDELQVKYEMLRAHFVDGQAVTAACAAFGYSRQTFYILRERLARRGIAGLRDGRPGRVGPVKCTDRKSTRLNSSHTVISYAVFCLKKKKKKKEKKKQTQEHIEINTT